MSTTVGGMERRFLSYYTCRSRISQSVSNCKVRPISGTRIRSGEKEDSWTGLRQLPDLNGFGMEPPDKEKEQPLFGTWSPRQ